MKIHTLFLTVMIFIIFGCVRQNTSCSPYSTVRLSFVGDVTFDWAVKHTLNAGIDPFREVAPIILSADLSIFNCESAITEMGQKVDKMFNFKSPPEVLKYLTNSGFKIASLANNHSMDYGVVGLINTMRNLSNYGIVYRGAGTNLSHATLPLIIDTNGVKIGILFYGYINPPNLAARTNSPGTAALDRELMIAKVKELRPMVDFITVVLHWGNEYQDLANKYQQKLGHQLIDNGADLIIGHHPHVPQGIEKYGKGVIFYSLGNFLFPQWKRIKTRMTYIVQVNVTKHSNPDKPIVPVYRIVPIFRDYNYYYPKIPDADMQTKILNHLIAISRPFDTKLNFIMDYTNGYTNYILNFEEGG